MCQKIEDSARLRVVFARSDLCSDLIAIVIVIAIVKAIVIVIAIVKAILNSIKDYSSHHETYISNFDV